MRRMRPNESRQYAPYWLSSAYNQMHVDLIRNNTLEIYMQPVYLSRDRWNSAPILLAVSWGWLEGWSTTRGACFYLNRRMSKINARLATSNCLNRSLSRKILLAIINNVPANFTRLSFWNQRNAHLRLQKVVVVTSKNMHSSSLPSSVCPNAVSFIHWKEHNFWIQLHISSLHFSSDLNNKWIMTELPYVKSAIFIWMLCDQHWFRMRVNILSGDSANTTENILFAYGFVVVSINCELLFFISDCYLHRITSDWVVGARNGRPLT